MHAGKFAGQNQRSSAMFRKQALPFVVSLLALAANACATHGARPATVAAASCPGATLHSESDAERFAACQVVEGDLTIAASDLEDLSALSDLRQVTGKLTITGNPQLYSARGLSELREV